MVTAEPKADKKTEAGIKAEMSQFVEVGDRHFTGCWQWDMGHYKTDHPIGQQDGEAETW